jgi:hypothetical protein
MRSTLSRLSAAALAVMLVLATTAAAATAPRFVIPDMTPSGGVLPQDLVVGDFTEDGAQDAAVANLGPDAFNGGVTVLPGNGAGELGGPLETDLGPQQGAQDLSETVDFDGDGRLDLAVQTGTTGGAGPIRVLLGNGDGTFRLGQQLQGGDGNIEAGDLTGDGDADIVFVYSGGAAIVRLFPGNGNGTFGAPIVYDVNWDAIDLELGDVDGDGRLDLAGAAGGPIWVMLQQPGGGLGPQKYAFSQDLSGVRLTLADFSRDGKLDVAVVTGDPGGGQSPELQIGRGVGDGTFAPLVQYSDVAGGSGAMATGDWTGDGRIDLVVAHAAPFTPTNLVALLPGRGNGTFSKPMYFNTGNGRLQPISLNGDGRLDLVAFSGDPGQVFATLGDSGPRTLEARGFEAPRYHETAHLGEPASGDVDNDGRVDLVLLGLVPDDPGPYDISVLVHLNVGQGRFSAPKLSPGGPVEIYEGPSPVVLADVSEDGKRDIVAAFTHVFPNPSNVWVFLGRGDGTFSPPVKYRTGEFSTSNQSLAVRDVTGDGHLDVVAHAPASGWQLAVLPGRGDGTFRPQITSGTSGPTQTSTLVADFTGEGVLDVVAIVKTGNEDIAGGDVRLQHGNGGGTFTLLQSLHVNSNPHISSGRVANLNGDSRPDVVFSGSRGSNAGVTGTWVLLNTGANFAAPVFYPTPAGLLDVADFDLDGDVDLVGHGYPNLTIRLNDGTGRFPTVHELITPYSSPALAADWNGDGAPDLMTLKGTWKSLYGLYVNLTK